ncbi:hydroxyacylglutathione hydrolase [Asticcacaulis sp.]|uniref:hydroxyacylglutathione hydrolase n=1 Tax=Asticcacaulis sp. TaxID=1872648 RepID=UPI002635BD67|nr:hydroxyacylglutathione hydrolase [Asticcacaulis sp.]
MSALQIHQFPALNDNYGFVVRDQASGQVACIDTPDAEAVTAALTAQGWGLDYILNTHWHPDHTGGNAALKDRYGCLIYGPEEVRKAAPLDQVLSGGDRFALGQTVFDVLDLKGHTLGHIGYSAPSENVAFVGDTLFALGCGRLFEGSAEDMWGSLQRLLALDPQTTLYCAHEYTLSNLKFAESLAPFPALEARGADIRARRARGEPTVPMRLADEIATNPFVVYPLKETGFDAQAAKFGEIRAAKDRF